MQRMTLAVASAQFVSDAGARMDVEYSSCFLLDLPLKLSAEHGEKLITLRISERHYLVIKQVRWYGNDTRRNTLTWLVEIDDRYLQTSNGTSTLCEEQRFPAVGALIGNVNIQVHCAFLPAPRCGDRTAQLSRLHFIIRYTILQVESCAKRGAAALPSRAQGHTRYSSRFN